MQFPLIAGQSIKQLREQHGLQQPQRSPLTTGEIEVHDADG